MTEATLGRDAGGRVLCRPLCNTRTWLGVCMLWAEVDWRNASAPSSTSRSELDLALADSIPSTSHHMNAITLLVLCYTLEHYSNTASPKVMRNTRHRLSFSNSPPSQTHLKHQESRPPASTVSTELFRREQDSSETNLIPAPYVATRLSWPGAVSKQFQAS